MSTRSSKYISVRSTAVRSGGALLLGLSAVLGAIWFTGSAASASSSHPAAFVRANVLGPSAAPAHSRELGAVPAGQSIRFGVVLAPSNQSEMSTLLSSLYDPSSARYHQWLQPGQFSRQFGPTSSEVASAENWLRGKGIDDLSLSGFSLEGSAPAQKLSSALGVSIDSFETPSGKVGYTTYGSPLLPATLAGGQVQEIIGLDSFAVPQPDFSLPGAGRALRGSGAVQAPPKPDADGFNPCSDATTEAANTGGFTMDQIGAQYGVGTLLNYGQNAHGETIGVYELAAHYSPDLSTYFSCFGLHNRVSTVNVDGGGVLSGNGTAEADLDIEQEATQAPGASIISYEGPDSGTGAYDTWSAIVTADAARVVSSSWGLCEALGGDNSYTTLLKQAAAQGQTVLVAAGDSGSEACFQSSQSDTQLGVQYPASDPWVTAVGGTTLSHGGTEDAWNYCYGNSGDSCAISNSGIGAGGGGISLSNSQVSGQPEAAGESANRKREVPDISANAGAAMVVYVDGGWNAGIGTSFAAPFVAGALADVYSGCSSYGLLSTELYRMYDGFANHGYGSVFNDVTSLGNDFTDTNSGDFPSASDYDLATGIGTPKVSAFVCPRVTRISSSSGDPGNEVTVSGSGLTNASIYFGSLKAQVVSESSTQAKVVVPAGGLSAVNVHATDAVGSGTIGQTFTYDHGYWLVGADGGVFTFPDAQFYGSTGNLHLQRPVVGITPHSGHTGYWLVASDGGVFTFTSNGGFFGSIPGLGIKPYGTPGSGRHLSAPIVGMVPAADGQGYYLVGSDGGVFAFGPGAKFVGSCPALRGGCSGPAVAVVPDASGNGYWLVTKTGNVYAFGDARGFGSPGTQGSSVTSATRTGDGNGYWILFADGKVVPFGDAHQLGEPTSHVNALDPANAIFATVDGDGYWVASANGSVFAYGDAPNKGGMNGRSLNAPIIAATGW
jgi:Pro-kumamolisin, activation domain/IPT/TIG domain